MKSLLLISMSLAMLSCLSGCVYNLKVEKFPTNIDANIYGTAPIEIIIPDSEPVLVVENLNYFTGKGATTQVDVNQMNRNAKDFITDYLHGKNITTRESWKKIKFQITKLQHELWGNPFFVSLQGCYLYFAVETSSGYRQEYKVQDQSGFSLDRAASGAVSRAVERMFSDPNIINFISES